MAKVTFENGNIVLTDEVQTIINEQELENQIEALENSKKEIQDRIVELKKIQTDFKNAK